MMPRSLLLLLIGTIAVVAANARTVVAEPKPAAVAIVVEHGTVFPPEATARLRVVIEPNASNRGLWTAIESSGYATAHYEDLPGARAPKMRIVEFKDLPDGRYAAWARLLKEHGEQSACATFIVGYDDESGQCP